MGGTCLPSGIYLCKGWVTGDKKFYRRSVTVHVHTRCFDRSMDRPRENSTNRQIKQRERIANRWCVFLWEEKQNETINQYISNSMHLIFTVYKRFADRVLLIPDVPKTPYRGGVGHMKE